METVSQAKLLNLISGLKKHKDATIESCRRLKSRFVEEKLAIFDALLESLIADSETHQRLLFAVQRMVEA